MRLIKLFLANIFIMLLCGCGNDLRRAEELYLQSQTATLEASNTLDDPLGEAIGILESHLSRNHDDPAGTLLLWRCYLRAGHPRAQAMHENMRRMPEPMHKILPDEIRREPDAQMRERMVYLLGEIATTQQIKALIKILENDREINVQRAAAEMLARIGDERAVSPLLGRLLAEQSAVRHYACRALASFPLPEVIDALFSCLQNPSEAADVRYQAAQSLAAIGKAAFYGKVDLMQRLERLQQEDGPVHTRLLAAYALAALGQNSGLDLAMTHARSEDVYLRGLAIIVLGHIGDKKALPFLTEALLHGNKVLRLQAAEALGRLGDVKALPSLHKALDDPHDAVRDAARQSINKIKAENSGK